MVMLKESSTLYEHRDKSVPRKVEVNVVQSKPDTYMYIK